MSGTVRSVAESGEVFADFSPYVAAIDSAGQVAFTARLCDGQVGVFQCGAGIRRLDRADSVASASSSIVSHPVVSVGCAWFFVEIDDGTALARLGDGVTELVTSAIFGEVGPLGPTASESGDIAFRARAVDGAPVIVRFATRTGSFDVVARCRGEISKFFGLPVIIGDGRVVVRADRASGAASIVACGDGHKTIVETGGRFTSLGHFPAANECGTVVFVATERGGCRGVYSSSVRDDRINLLIDQRAGFKSFRGALVDAADEVVFYATPVGGALAVYRLDGTTPRRIIGLGDAYRQSNVTEVALNPVSISRDGALAIRLGLADGGQHIVTA